MHIKHPRLAMCVEITTPSMFFLRRPLSRVHKIWIFDGKLRGPVHNAPISCEYFMITGKALGSLMARVFKTRRLQSRDFNFVPINNSSAPGLLEKVAVRGDYGYTPTKQSAVPDGVELWGVGRESQQQSSGPL